MFKVGVGASTEKATLAAAATAARRAMDRAGLAQADFALVFATIPHSSLYGRMLERIAESTRTRHLVGCSAMAIVTSDGEVEDEPAVAVLALASDTLTATPFLVPSLPPPGGGAGRRVGRGVPAPPGGAVFPPPPPVAGLPDALPGYDDLAGGSVPRRALPVVAGGAGGRRRGLGKRDPDAHLPVVRHRGRLRRGVRCAVLGRVEPGVRAHGRLPAHRRTASGHTRRGPRHLRVERPPGLRRLHRPGPGVGAARPPVRRRPLLPRFSVRSLAHAPGARRGLRAQHPRRGSPGGIAAGRIAGAGGTGAVVHRPRSRARAPRHGGPGGRSRPGLRGAAAAGRRLLQMLRPRAPVV